MQGLQGLAWLLAMQSLGELLSRGLALPFPGPVIGMLLAAAGLALALGARAGGGLRWVFAVSICRCCLCLWALA
jgi:putative effector of murein hydrolase LrgA (UPF0299 family)